MEKLLAAITNGSAGLRGDEEIHWANEFSGRISGGLKVLAVIEKARAPLIHDPACHWSLGGKTACGYWYIDELPASEKMQRPPKIVFGIKGSIAP